MCVFRLDTALPPWIKTDSWRGKFPVAKGLSLANDRLFGEGV